MLVTDILEFTKSRYRIFLDYEFAFVLYKGELHKFGIKKDTEISDDIYNEIMGKLLPERARKRAYNLLAERCYTEKQLKDKLSDGGYPQVVIESVIRECTEHKYVDDGLFAIRYIEQFSQKRSRIRISNDLKLKGISPELIDEAFSTAQSEGYSSDEISMAVELLKKKKYDPEKTSLQEKQKLSGFLYRKGFSGDTIRRALLLDITLNSV
jgi:regulatory protein